MKIAVVYEGCGSVNSAGEFGPVERPKIVTVAATVQQGRKFQIKADGLLGRVILHEFDHLNGIEFLDKAPDKSKIVSREVYIKDFKEAPDRIKNSKITIVEYKNLTP